MIDERLRVFPFFFGRAFIEGHHIPKVCGLYLQDFPSFSEELSLRRRGVLLWLSRSSVFPFLCGGAFIEAHTGAACG